MEIGDKVIYDFYGRDIITRIKDIQDGQILVVGLASYQPQEMFRQYDDGAGNEGMVREGDTEAKNDGDTSFPNSGEHSSGSPQRVTG